MTQLETQLEVKITLMVIQAKDISKLEMQVHTLGQLLLDYGELMVEFPLMVNSQDIIQNKLLTMLLVTITGQLEINSITP